MKKIIKWGIITSIVSIVIILAIGVKGVTLENNTSNLKSSITLVESELDSSYLNLSWGDEGDIPYRIQVSVDEGFSNVIYDKLIHKDDKIKLENTGSDGYYVRFMGMRGSLPLFFWSDVFVYKNHEHSYIEDKAMRVDPSCKEEGIKYSRCSDCSNLVSSTLSKLDCEYEEESRVDSTCSKKGFIVLKCRNCEATIKEELNYKEHEYKLVDKKEPSVDEEGYKKYKCTNCNKKYTTIQPKVKVVRGGYIDTLVIDEVGLSVPVYESCSENSYASLQTIVDWGNSAAYLTINGQSIIGDHKHQGFDKIKKVSVGTKAIFNGKTYTCISKFNGYNIESDLTNGDGVSISELEGSLALYTCNENWRNVTITMWS